MEQTHRIAILGYSVRAPGARTVHELWPLLEAGRDAVTRANTNVGVTSTNRVHAYGALDGITEFDAEYFNLTPREAQDIDPQQRFLLECAVESLEASCVDPTDDSIDVGVWTSTGLSGYLLETMDPGRFGLDSTAQLMGGDHNYSATRIAYALGLTGPAIAVASACSSSLLAIHYAAQTILNGECDVALAGGMDIEYPPPTSYLYQNEGILSPDGICRPFDADAKGTVFGSGGGLVTLADMALAIERGWPIVAELAGSAVNNDGGGKASFTAPKPSRQADVILQALSASGLRPADVRYIECHGTGTAVGDRSELEALSSVFGTDSNILIGSIKANIGHLRVGAGVVAFIKACEALKHASFPPLANLDHAASAVTEHGFIVSRSATPISLTEKPAFGISSFGFGGTNVHAVLVPYLSASKTLREPFPGPQVIPVSAPDPDTCIAYAQRLADAFESTPPPDVASVSRTLAETRRSERYRLAAIAQDPAGAALALRADPATSVEGWARHESETLILFAGQGTDLHPISEALWRRSDVFTETVERFCKLADIPLAAVEHPEPVDLSTGQRHVLHTATQLGAVADLMAKGLKVVYTAGESLGEYSATALSGAVSAGSVVEALLRRGRLLDGSPRGRSFVVAATPEEIRSRVPGVEISGYISSKRTMITCLEQDSGMVEDALGDGGFQWRPTTTTVPYHSPYLREVAHEFGSDESPSPTGGGITWIRTLASPAGDDLASYWERHLDSPMDLRKIGREISGLSSAHVTVVDFSRDGSLGRSLDMLGKRKSDLVRMVDPAVKAVMCYQRALAQLWVIGHEVAVNERGHGRLLTGLPTRPWKRSVFAKNRAAETAQERADGSRGTVQRELDIDKWIYQPSWKLARRPVGQQSFAGQRWLMFGGDGDFTEDLAERVKSAGINLVSMPLDEGLTSLERETAIRGRIAQTIAGGRIDRVLHLSPTSEGDGAGSFEDRTKALEREMDSGFYSLLFTFQEISRLQGAYPIELDIVAKGVHPLDSKRSVPSRSLLLGPAKVLPQDLPFVIGRSIDITDCSERDAAREVANELFCGAQDASVTLAGGQRWVRSYERDRLPPVLPGKIPSRLRERGVYLITGGLGGIGMTLAEYLVRTCRARLVLTSLESVPDSTSNEEDEAVQRRRAQIQRLEDLGGEVMALNSDISSLSDTHHLVETIEARYGALNGVIHAAGVFETQKAFRSISETSRADCVRRLLPKVQGTLVLAEVLEGRSLDFLITQSSLSAQLGGLGFYAYTAGNAFMDAFTEAHRSPAQPWMSVNWDGWIFRERTADVVAQSVVSPSFASPDFGVVAEIAIRPSEGADIYARIMDVEVPAQVLVSTADFESRFRKWINPRAAQPGLHDGSDASGVDSIERRLMRIWEELLGVSELTSKSEFFSVGGDSLTGVSLAHRISVEFGVVLSAITLFERSTVEEMAASIRESVTSHEEGGEGHVAR